MQQEHSQIKNTNNKEKWKLSDTQIQYILKLYFDNGWKKSRIARKIGVDHTTVIYHINKHLEFKKCFSKKKKVVAETFVPIKRKVHPLIEQEENEPINMGLNYEDYLDIDRQRLLVKQSQCGHNVVVCTYRCTDCGKVHTKEFFVDKSVSMALSGGIIN